MNCQRIALMLLLFLAVIGKTGWSQTDHSIKGRIHDSTTNQNLENAGVAVLHASDSTLAGLAWTSVKGDFLITKLKTGRYILLVSFPEFADYITVFNITRENPQQDFGILNLLSKSQLLKEFVVKGKVSLLKVNGDTTEYNAKALKIEPSDKVEDLLKQILGLQVDQDGRLTAYGKPVKKVLVDGEEFFGDDPTLVTRNIRGDMVDKIQLYDKKSEKAELTGIDDGEKTKTINIKLKEDKKNGSFGNVIAGIASNSRHQQQGAFNRFREKKKIAFYGNISNTGKTGLSRSQNDKYGITGSTLRIFLNDIIASTGSADEQTFAGENYSGEGNPFSRTAGIHADSKWNKDKESINLNYKIGALKVTGLRTALTQIDLPDATIKTASEQRFETNLFFQRLDANYQYKPSPSATLSVAIDAGSGKNNAQTNSSTQVRHGLDSLVNHGTRSLISDADQQIISSVNCPEIG